jgi:hypothetical protein
MRYALSYGRQQSPNITEDAMIKNSKQNWDIGQQVKVGFVSGLTVIGKLATPGDYAPDAYVLARGVAFYSFVPHNGLTRISQNEAAEMIAEANRLNQKAIAQTKADAVKWADAVHFQAAVIAAAV